MIRFPAIARTASAGLLAAACLLAGAPERGCAATRAGVSVPDTMQVGGSTLVLNGIGLRSFTILQIRGYVGALYLLRKSSDVGTILAEPNPKVLIVNYIHSATVAQVSRSYTDSSRAYCSRHTCTEADRTAFMAMLSAIRPVKPGDTQTFVMTDKGVQELLNGQQVLFVPDPGFGRVILDSDLGTTASSAALRDGLLGLPDN